MVKPQHILCSKSIKGVVINVSLMSTHKCRIGKVQCNLTVTFLAAKSSTKVFFGFEFKIIPLVREKVKYWKGFN